MNVRCTRSGAGRVVVGGSLPRACFAINDLVLVGSNGDDGGDGDDNEVG